MAYWCQVMFCWIMAKYFILACCSIQNARLLLASNKQAKRGLGNDNDLVGRYFMEHIEIKSAELWLTRPEALKLYAIDFGKTKARAELAISAEKQRELKILNGTAVQCSTMMRWTDVPWLVFTFSR